MSIPVKAMFASIASRYDLSNDLLSLGAHRLWRREALRFSGIKLEGKTVLDLCTGTGDLALLLSTKTGETGTVIGVDFSQPMLRRAQRKIPQLTSGRLPIFLCSDALALPFGPAVFDIATVAFGIRNVDCVDVCLQELKRVLKPGATLVVLEFGKPELPFVRSVFSLYSQWIMPVIGGVLTGNLSAYRYLHLSSFAFPAGVAFLQKMQCHGFANTRMKALFGGIAYIYTGVQGKFIQTC